MTELATYQPPLPIEEFTETVTYWARVANPAAYGGWETTHHTIKETAITDLADDNLQRALQIQLNLTRGHGMLYLPICDEAHALSHSVAIQRGPIRLPESMLEEPVLDEVLPIFAEPPQRHRIFAWAGRLLSR